ncbi:tetratricopeptide repeat protein [Jannaschia ovalis]|uniref:Tetratricopeptide repeat protein n=1 Tax=Jannaschia ovalis TaxID=3038773 RepID=A0ABY8LD36_9RHOB|nr:tetratricopeptide repeat protein [Jannaschia sp. GRR-S6-38]WGH79051.1 tetratricopeptide repeat protein [Jannaschia sp. GRR-S6-38]
MMNLRVTLKALILSVVAGYATFSAAQELEGDADALLNRLSTLTAEHDADEAARLAREIQERWTHSGSATGDLLLQRGIEAIAAEDYPKAITHLTALTDHAPDFAEAWNQRATAFFYLERYGAAVSDIEQVLVLEPRHFGALAGLGIIMERLGDDRAALRALEAAQKIHPAEANVNAAVDRLRAQTGGRTL